MLGDEDTRGPYARSGSSRNVRRKHWKYGPSEHATVTDVPAEVMEPEAVHAHRPCIATNGSEA